MRVIWALPTGMVFGTGIAVSGMINPAKVLNFFDIAGTWDPSLALVMLGALIVTGIGYRVVLRRDVPILAHRFQLPTRRDIDLRLVGGAAVFGIGWGIAGFCPGAAIPALGLGHADTLIFVAAMIGGMLVARIPHTRIPTR